MCIVATVRSLLVLTVLVPVLSVATTSNDPQQQPFGAYDPVFTPFYSNGSLNVEVIPAYANFTTSMGTDTIILGGSTGEWPSLTSEERILCLKAWRAALDELKQTTKSVPKLLFHAGDTALVRAVELARQAQQYGADEILIVAPCIMKPATLDVLIEVIGLVAAAAPNLPAWLVSCQACFFVASPPINE